jgi:DNA-binding transcriptional MerR regulator
MTGVILTLFGEELTPEQIKAAGKARVPRKKAAKAEDKQDAEPQVLRGWAADKQYYSIGEVAELFQVKTSHIRFWTNEFEMKVRTTKKGDRLYAPDHINELRLIYHLVKERGYTINGAKTKLKGDKALSVATVDLKQSLLHLRNQLVHIRNHLT